MSSIIVYGYSNSSKIVITKETIPQPTSFYGDSKFQAENGIIDLADDSFTVVILSLPMIYGKESKGNYLRLAKASKKHPMFLNINNKRSMLHIDNLSEFIKLMIDNE